MFEIWCFLYFEVVFDLLGSLFRASILISMLSMRTSFDFDDFFFCLILVVMFEYSS